MAIHAHPRDKRATRSTYRRQGTLRLGVVLVNWFFILRNKSGAGEEAAARAAPFPSIISPPE